MNTSFETTVIMPSCGELKNIIAQKNTNNLDITNIVVNLLAEETLNAKSIEAVRKLELTDYAKSLQETEESEDFLVDDHTAEAGQLFDAIIDALIAGRSNLQEELSALRKNRKK